MPLGFLKSSKEHAGKAARSARHAGGKGRDQSHCAPVRTDILSDVEELGIGMFWATDAEGHLTFLSQRALDDLGSDGGELIGRPLSQVFSDVEPEPGAPVQRAIGFKLKARSKIEEHVVGVGATNKRGSEPTIRWRRWAQGPSRSPSGARRTRPRRPSSSLI